MEPFVVHLMASVRQPVLTVKQARFASTAHVLQTHAKMLSVRVAKFVKMGSVSKLPAKMTLKHADTRELVVQKAVRMTVAKGSFVLKTLHANPDPVFEPKSLNPSPNLSLLPNLQ